MPSAISLLSPIKFWAVGAALLIERMRGRVKLSLHPIFTLFDVTLFLSRSDTPARAGGVREGELFKHLRVIHGVHAPGMGFNSAQLHLRA